MCLTRSVLTRRAATLSEWEYPFAVGGLNVTYMLTELLELRKEPDVPRSAVFKCAPPLLGSPLDSILTWNNCYRLEPSEQGVANNMNEGPHERLQQAQDTAAGLRAQCSAPCARSSRAKQPHPTAEGSPSCWRRTRAR